MIGTCPLQTFLSSSTTLRAAPMVHVRGVRKQLRSHSRAIVVRAPSIAVCRHAPEIAVGAEHQLACVGAAARKAQDERHVVWRVLHVMLTWPRVLRSALQLHPCFLDISVDVFRMRPNRWRPILAIAPSMADRVSATRSSTPLPRAPLTLPSSPRFVIETLLGCTGACIPPTKLRLTLPRAHRPSSPAH